MKMLRQYIRRVLREALQAKPSAIFMAGGPASGKSTAIRKLGIGSQLTVVNPDDDYEAALKKAGIPLDRKDLLEEYKLAKAAFLEAQEAGDEQAMSDAEPEYRRLRAIFSQNMTLFSRARNAAKHLKKSLMGAGDNVLIDGTGGNYREISKQFKEFAAVGYEVGMIYVDVPLEVSLARNANRAAQGGRGVDEEDVIRSWKAVERNREAYEKLFKENFFYIDAAETQFDSSIASIKSNVLRFLGSSV
jgi:predicted kinase